MHAVALQRRGVGILHTEVSQRPVPGSGRLIRRSLRRRVGGTIEEHELRIDLFGIPRHLRALGGFVDAQPQAIEYLRQRQPARADHLRKGLGVSAVRPLLFRGDGARRGVEGDEHVRLRFDQSQAARDRLAAFDEGLLTRGIEHHDVRFQRQRRKLTHIVADPQTLDRDVGVTAERGVNRYEVVLAGKLDSMTGQVHHRDRIGTRGLGFLHEVAEASPQRIPVKVARPDHIETGRLQRLSDQACVIRRGGQRGLRIGPVTDHECDPLLLLLRGGGTRCARKSAEQQQAQRKGRKGPGHLHGSLPHEFYPGSILGAQHLNIV